MATPASLPPEIAPPAAPPRSASDNFVTAAQVLVLVAFAAGLSIQGGINPGYTISALVAVLLMGVAHKQIMSGDRPSPRTAAPHRKIKRTEKRVSGAVPVAARVPQQRATPPPMPSAMPGATRAPTPDAGPRAPDYAVRSDDIAPSLSAATAAGPELRADRGPELRANRAPELRAERAPELRAERPSDLRAERPSDLRAERPMTPLHDPRNRTQDPPALPSNAYGASDPMQSYWSMSPGAPRLAPVPASPPPLPPVANELRETDVEIIQKLIRKLADDVNATEALSASAVPAITDTPPPVDAGAFAQQGAELPPPLPMAASQDPGPTMLPGATLAASSAAFSHAIENSLEALRVTADSMRSPSDVVFRTSTPPPLPEPAVPLATAPSVAAVAPPPLPDMGPSRASILADAISSGRIDVMLEPILGLDDQEARHFEVSIRLRDGDGQVLDSNPRAQDLSGTGLLPLYDAARLHRTLNVAARLSERGKLGSVFSLYSAEALNSQSFLADAAEAMHRRDPGAGQLVLSFDQSDVRGFEAPQWQAIADMRALGFRFALAGITDFDMDFGWLAAAGFAFAKLDANVFLEGLQVPSGLVPPADVCRHLSLAGLTLVVERIDDPDKLARVFGFGVLFGQGHLFGGPRALKQDAVKAASQHAVA